VETDSCPCGSEEREALCCGLTPAKQERRPGLQKQIQPSRWTCLPTAFAMVMDVPVASLMVILGRDDDRGFHVQELLGIAMALGRDFTPFEAAPDMDRAQCWDCEGKGWLAGVPCTKCGATGFELLPALVLPTFSGLLTCRSGVLVGRRCDTGKDHAVAWCHVTQKILDPERGVYDLELFQIDTFWSTPAGVGCVQATKM